MNVNFSATNSTKIEKMSKSSFNARSDDKPSFATTMNNRKAFKKNNSEASESGKFEIRRRLLEFMTPTGACVFDAFAGHGRMYDNVWQHAQSYVGCDQEFFRDNREMFCADNKRVLRAIPLDRFNIFDLDAYGMPWEQAMIVAARRPVVHGAKVGFVFTDGGFSSAQLNVKSLVLRQLTGLSMTPGMSHDYEMIHRKAIHKIGELMLCRVAQHWHFAGVKKKVHYSAVVYDRQ
jgi:hypothetical protein